MLAQQVAQDQAVGRAEGEAKSITDPLDLVRDMVAGRRWDAPVPCRSDSVGRRRARRAGGRLGRRRRGLRPVHHQRLDPVRDALGGLAQLLDKTKTLLEECQQERDRAATGDLPFVRQEKYGAWRYKAQLAVDNAKSMLADEAGNAPFFKENPGLRQTLAAWRPLDRTMREEREDWERIKQERAEQKRLERRRSRSQGISM